MVSSDFVETGAQHVRIIQNIKGGRSGVEVEGKEGGVQNVAQLIETLTGSEESWPRSHTGNSGSPCRGRSVSRKRHMIEMLENVSCIAGLRYPCERRRPPIYS